MKRFALAIGVVIAVLMLHAGAPAEAATVSFDFLNGNIRPNDSFQINVFAQEEATAGDLTAFGFNVNIGAPITFDGYTIDPAYLNDSAAFPVDVAGAKADLTPNAGDNLLLATLDFTAGPTGGTYVLAIDGSVDFFSGSGGYYENEPLGIDLIGQTDINVVPIPGAVWLLGAGLMGLIGIRRKFGRR